MIRTPTWFRSYSHNALTVSVLGLGLTLGCSSGKPKPTPLVTSILANGAIDQNSINISSNSILGFVYAQSFTTNGAGLLVKDTRYEELVAVVNTAVRLFQLVDLTTSDVGTNNNKQMWKLVQEVTTDSVGQYKFDNIDTSKKIFIELVIPIKPNRYSNSDLDDVATDSNNLYVYRSNLEGKEVGCHDYRKFLASLTGRDSSARSSCTVNINVIDTKNILLVSKNWYEVANCNSVCSYSDSTGADGKTDGNVSMLPFYNYASSTYLSPQKSDFNTSVIDVVNPGRLAAEKSNRQNALDICHVFTEYGVDILLATSTFVAGAVLAGPKFTRWYMKNKQAKKGLVLISSSALTAAAPLAVEDLNLKNEIMQIAKASLKTSESVSKMSESVLKVSGESNEKTLEIAALIKDKGKLEQDYQIRKKYSQMLNTQLAQERVVSAELREYKCAHPETFPKLDNVKPPAYK